MASSPGPAYDRIAVDCPLCKANQTVHVAVQLAPAVHMINHKIVCAACGQEFGVLVPNAIVGGPFLTLA